MNNNFPKTSGLSSFPFLLSTFPFLFMDPKDETEKKHESHVHELALVNKEFTPKWKPLRNLLQLESGDTVVLARQVWKGELLEVWSNNTSIGLGGEMALEDVVMSTMQKFRTWCKPEDTILRGRLEQAFDTWPAILQKFVEEGKPKLSLVCATWFEENRVEIAMATMTRKDKVVEYYYSYKSLCLGNKLLSPDIAMCLRCDEWDVEKDVLKHASFLLRRLLK